MSEKKTESRQAMAMKATVQQKFGDACEYGENQINQWPRQYRFTRGTRMLELMDEIAVLLEMAQRKYRIKTSLHEADARLAALFRLLRRSNCAKYKVTRRVSGKPAKDENGAQITDMKRLVDDHTYIITPHGIRLRKRTVRHAKRAMKHIEEMYAIGAIDLDSALDTIRSYIGMSQHKNGYNLRRWIEENIVLQRNGTRREQAYESISESR